MMEEISGRTGCRIKWVNGVSLKEVMRDKGRSRIVIDDLVTGSYHLSGLEGLSLGRAVLCYLDERTRSILKAVSGATELPFVNVRLEDAPSVIEHLLENQDTIDAIGKESRRWIDRYWSEGRLVSHFEQLYEDLVEDPTRIRKQDRFVLDGPVRRFFSVHLPDCIYESRAENRKRAFNGS